ncbi:hypothetical protein BH23ACT1_BH23ACT1_15100 [soil metagenome]|jgi:DNA anti-recombination protein RmuC
MPVDERSRHQLFRRLDEVLGPDQAATLIDHLPPVGWADVATKRDLDALELRLDQRFALIDKRFDHMAGSFDQRFAQIDERFDHMAGSFDQRFDHLSGSVEARFDRADERFGWMDDNFGQRLEAAKQELIGLFHRELNAQTKTVVFGMVTIVLTMAALAFALVRFT